SARRAAGSRGPGSAGRSPQAGRRRAARTWAPGGPASRRTRPRPTSSDPGPFLHIGTVARAARGAGWWHGTDRDPGPPLLGGDRADPRRRLLRARTTGSRAEDRAAR